MSAWATRLAPPGDPMGLLDLLIGRVQPAPGTVAQPPSAVRQALLALDRPTAPYTVRPAEPEERGDVVAEWRIVDARWLEILAHAGLKENFQVFMRLDPATHSVRALDRSARLEWRAGWPNSFIEGEVRWGREFTKSFGAAVGFTETLRPGVIYAYRFDSSEIKRPLQDAVVAAGWTWRAVGLGRL